MGILQARIMEWSCHDLHQAICPTQGSNPCLLHCRWILYCLSRCTPFKAHASSNLTNSCLGPFCVWVTQLCLTLCEPIDWGSPGSSIYGISQSRILEWVAIPFVRGSSQPRSWTWSPTLQADSLLCEPLKKPLGKPLLLGALIWLLLYVFPILNFFQHNVCILFILQDLFYLYVLFSICYSFWKLTCSCIFLCKPHYVRNVMRLILSPLLIYPDY